MTSSPLTLFDARYFEPVDARTQVERLPGVDAPCLCDPPRNPCMWSFCPWKRPEKEDDP